MDKMEKKEFVEFIKSEADIFAKSYKLSPRESQILRLIMVSSTKDAHAISAELGIEPGTVRTYMADIYKKTKTKSREELAMKFLNFATSEKPLPAMQIIAIDDDQAFLEKISLAVEGVFHTRENFKIVTGAESIEALLEDLRNNGNHPDLLLVDLYMPGLDGYEVVKRVRQDPVLSGIRIVTFSSTTNPEDTRRVLAMGSTSFVSKTADVKKLQKLLRNVFQYWGEIAPAKRSS